jgi:hypothetical protein
LSNLDDALKAIRVDEEIRRNVLPDLKYLCLSMGIPPHTFLAMAWHGRGKTIFKSDASTAGRI